MRFQEIMTWKIATIILAVLLVLTGLGGFFFYGNYRYDTGYQAGYDAYADPDNPGPAIGEAWNAGYAEAYAEVAERIGLSATSSVNAVKAELAQLVSLPEPLRDPSLGELEALLEGYEKELAYAWPIITSWELARDFQEYAREQGFRCGVVRLVLYDNDITKFVGFINVFDLETGLTYVEPRTPPNQPAKIVTVEMGEAYFEVNDLPGQEGLDDTIIYISDPAW